MQKASVKRFKCFHEYGMEANKDKCNFLSSLDISTKFLLPACMLENVGSQKRPGVTNDKKINFNKHNTDQSGKASRKIQALASIFPIHTPNAKTTFNECLFCLKGYYPLVWNTQ